MSSTSVSSTPTPEPTSRPPTLIPQVDLTMLAKTTRKTLERLVPFSHMRTPSDEPSPRLTKIINKINHYITLIDDSMFCEQIGYQLANNCMALCDPELRVGLSTPVTGKNTGIAATRGRGGAWTPLGVTGQTGTADACIFGREDARELAGQGHKIAWKVKEEFSGIAQEMYRIAASTKDDILLVHVPPDPTHSDTLKIQLKDVGTNLVANLSLLSEFSKAVSEVADWWCSVKDDLTLEESSLLVPTSPQCGDEGEHDGNIEGEKFAWWSEIRDDFQEYYDGINGVHLRFPELLPSSSAAWQSVASARSQAPSSTGHSNILHQSQRRPVGGNKGGLRLGSFMLGWKRMNKEKGGGETKSKKTLLKRKQSNQKDNMEVKVKKNGTPKLNETGDENNTKKGSSKSSASTPLATRSSTEVTRVEVPDTKVRSMKRSLSLV